MIIPSDRYRKASDSVIRIISKILPKSKYKYIDSYNGRSITIRPKLDENDETYLYIRITYTERGFIADMTNIVLDISIQHKGIFSMIVKELQKSRSINGIWVSSVITDEMHNACRKLGMHYTERISGYELNW